MADVTVLQISQLRALTANPPATASYFTSDTGKEDLWYLSATSGTDNEGTILNDLGGNTWRRLIEDDQLRPEWFDAIGSGNVNDNDTVAINNTIKAAQGRKVYFSANKTYMVDSIIIDRPVTLNGEGTLKKRVIISPGTLIPILTLNQPVININAGVTDIIIEGITIDGNRDDILLAKPDYSFPNYLNSKFQGIRAISTASNLIERVKIFNATIKNTWNEAFYLDCGNNIQFLNSTVIKCQQAGFIDGTQSRTTAALFIRASFNTGYANTVFENIEVSGCYFDQTGVYNGCVKIQAISGNTFANVQVCNNNLWIEDRVIPPPTPPTADEVGIIGVEIHATKYLVQTNPTVEAYGIQKQVYVCDNVITSIPIAGAAVIHDFGISVAGTSDSVDTGIIGVLISGNQIIDCHRFSIEAIGKNMTLTNNLMTRSGVISINSTNVQGGMHDIKVIGNTMIDTYVGENGSNYKRFYACIHINTSYKTGSQKANFVNGVLIEANTFDGLTGGFYDSDIIFITAGEDEEIELPPTLLYNVDIIGNQFLNIRRSGIFLNGFSRIENISIVSNKFTYEYNAEAQTAGYAITSSADKVNNFVISNNSFDCRKYINNVPDPSKAFGSAIRIGTTGSHKRVRITDNNINYVLYGILVQQQIDGFIVTDNMVSDYTTGISITTQAGPSTNRLITNNIQIV